MRGSNSGSGDPGGQLSERMGQQATDVPVEGSSGEQSGRPQPENAQQGSTRAGA